MSKAIQNPVNKKVAFLTFKIVEETVKRVCLKSEIDRLTPVGPDTIATVKKVLNIPEGTAKVSTAYVAGAVHGITPIKDRSSII